MTEATSSKSLVEQIINAWFAELENAEEFDASTIGQLKNLASAKALRKPTQVTKAIKVIPEVQDETP
jgi:hypothetical protein